MNSLIALAGCMFLAAPAARAQEAHCSLRVRATFRDGTPIHAFASVVDGTGRVQEKRITPAGGEFCDLGIQDVQVTFAPISISCNWTVTVGARLKWGTTTDLSVVVPEQKCEYMPHLSQRSAVLIRAVDEDGKGLPGAKVEVEEPETARRAYVADSYGRVLVPRVPFGAELKAVVSAADHKSRSVQIKCDREDVEKNVELLWAGRGAQGSTPASSAMASTLLAGLDLPLPKRMTATGTYPHLAGLAAVQGEVSLRLVVAKDGAVRSAKVTSGHCLLADAALQDAQAWQFDPPVGEVEVPVTFRYRLLKETCWSGACVARVEAYPQSRTIVITAPTPRANID